jgi:hypothetical protein
MTSISYAFSPSKECFEQYFISIYRSKKWYDRCFNCSGPKLEIFKQALMLLLLLFLSFICLFRSIKKKIASVWDLHQSYKISLVVYRNDTKMFNLLFPPISTTGNLISITFYVIVRERNIQIIFCRYAETVLTFMSACLWDHNNLSNRPL